MNPFIKSCTDENTSLINMDLVRYIDKSTMAEIKDFGHVFWIIFHFSENHYITWNYSRPSFNDRYKKFITDLHKIEDYFST